MWRSGKRASKQAPWRQALLFRDLPLTALDALADLLERREVAAGDYITREGEQSSDLYWVERGSVELFKRDPLREVDHHIDTLSAGDCIGELALIDGLPRSTTARARAPSVLWVLPFSKIEKRARSLSSREARALDEIHQHLVLNLARVLSARLRDKADESLKVAQERAAMGQFIVNVLILLVVYLVVVGALPQMRQRLPSSSSYVSIPLQIVFAWGSWAFIRGTGYPMWHFGIGWRSLVGSVLEAAIFTLPFLGVVTALKWLVLVLGPGWSELPLIEYPDVRERLTDPAVLKLLVIYFVSSAVQELIVRGALQSSLEMFLTGRRRVTSAILVSGLLFASMHIHMGFLFASLAFVPGVFWGWLFSRKRNLVGVTLSHVAVGAYVFFILGISLG